MKNSRVQPIKSADTDAPTSKLTVIGKFEGECADSNVTNENGLNIEAPVWETVFASDLYKQALEHGWYIGFLGHPEDPNCMDFEHACIVMRDCHIEDNGKVYGTFDLIDTPVGKIVKAFIDAGVVFGISVRGAGDIIDNSVDPDTFIFRGFDLVTFPAFKEAIPTFTEIAASSDLTKQKQYKAVCAAVKKNLQSLNTPAAIDIVQSQFAKQSDEYRMLESRRIELSGVGASEDISSEQVEGITQLYLSACSEIESLKAENSVLRQQVKTVQSAASRKIKVIQRITAAQTRDLEDELVNVTHAYQTIKAASQHLKHENEILASSNLKYKQRVEATANDISKKNSVISKLRSKLTETVNAATATDARTSNLDAIVKKLRREVQAATALVNEYQQAYGNMYADALGVHLEDVRVTSTTTVKELQSMIQAGYATDSNLSAFSGSTEIESLNEFDDGESLVTL